MQKLVGKRAPRLITSKVPQFILHLNKYPFDQESIRKSFDTKWPLVKNSHKIAKGRHDLCFPAQRLFK